MYKIHYIVELESNRVYLAQGKGDPCRTKSRTLAQPFKTKSAAKAGLTRARKYRPFENAGIYKIQVWC